MTRVLDPAEIAETFRDQIRTEVSALAEPLLLAGVIAADHGPSVTYAEYTARACADVGVHFELRRASRLDIEATVRAANADPRVHGIMIYYPIFGTGQDGYLRETIDAGKDVEGLRRSWAQFLYENRRFMDAEQTKKAILPCTPLAIMKLVEAAGFLAESARPLEGRSVCIFNRSEVVGRPLGAMMANDGARVFSFDVDAPLLFLPARPGGRHEVAETTVSRQSALAQADIVVTGVPSRGFPQVRAGEIREGALCINFSTRRNFDPDIIGKAGVFVPRVGPMTVTMALRNTLRLYRNRHDATQ
jgi:methylenetetrahydrofolate dehydrogenase (NADP+)/methenyltetrahydrofolate cyclohydrolase